MGLFDISQRRTPLATADADDALPDVDGLGEDLDIKLPDDARLEGH
jgi:hypothetical protein